MRNPAFAAAGFASISDALSQDSKGNGLILNGGIIKNGPTGVLASAHSLWRLGAAPAAGAAGSAAPGGRAPTSATTGAMVYTNPATGTLRLVGADMSCTVANNALLVYDRCFDVAKTINSTATEAVSGTLTRFNSSTTTSENYSAGNFLFVEVGVTALANTAHNWTVCQYTNQAGTATQTIPSFAGNPGAVATIADRLDMPINTWWAPLASGDTGIQALSQMQCSALVATGTCNFVIGHPIGVMSFPVANIVAPFDWLTNRKQAPYIPNSACVSLLELPKPSTTATNYSGMIYATSTSS
jgi:hypothetical protein